MKKNLMCMAVGAASQWWSNERMMFYIKLMLVDDGEMLVNDGEMIVGSYTHFTIISLYRL